jgi:DNA-directed RNA polymerase subunit H (RpoH/RPB5)
MIHAINKTDDERINEAKITVINMLHNRGFIHKNNIESKTEKLLSKNLPEYEITLDVNENYNTKIPSGKIYLKFINQEITTSSKSSEIGDYILKNMNKYKIIVIDKITLKLEKNVFNYNTEYEIFKLTELQQDITKFILYSPHVVLNQEQSQQVIIDYNATGRQMPLINYGLDPVARYFNMKIGDICEIYRPSQTSGINKTYRLCAKNINTP